MKTMSAREAKHALELMIGTARAEPGLIEKHGRGVVMVTSVEEFERLVLKKDASEWAVALLKGGPKTYK
jgi:PHD/YefM family antitoxin component YafN of YafNO toxin-antitoxin module